ncbi:MAG: NAD(P)-dependent oxidoreductase [Leadbetterella sp.]
MRIALFGATGGTGIEFLKQSIAYSHEITAFVRSPEKLRNQFPNLHIVKASIDDYTILQQTVTKFDVIISLVGVAGLLQARKPNELYAKTAKNLVRVADENKISKLIVVTSGGVVEAPNEPWFFKYLLKPFFLKKMYEDMKIMEQIVQKSNLEYTIVRPPYLTNGKLTKDYRIVIDKWFDDDKDLSRADLAHYLLNCIEDESITKRVIGVSM